MEITKENACDSTAFSMLVSITDLYRLIFFFFIIVGSGGLFEGLNNLAIGEAVSIELEIAVNFFRCFLL